MILTLTVSSAVLIGRAQPIPERVAALHLGDRCALPCWIGITPGKTTRAEAERMIKQLYGHEIKFGSTERGGITFNLDPPRNGNFPSITLYTLADHQGSDTVVSGVELRIDDIQVGNVFDHSEINNFVYTGCVPVIYLNIVNNGYRSFIISCPVTDEAKPQKISIESTVFTVNINSEKHSTPEGADQNWHGFGVYP